MSVPAEQLQMPGMREFARYPKRPFTLSEIRGLKNESDAIELSINCSPYEAKAIPVMLDIDEGQWSCIKKGTKYFPHNRRNEFMDLVENEILLMYGNESRGYDFSTLRKHQSDVEQRLEASEAEVRRLKHEAELKDEWIQKLVGGRR